MIKVGITGQAGFIGTHLCNFLSLKEKEINLVSFRDEIFNSEKELIQWTKKCDVIIHLAAINRHGDPQIVYDTNVELVKKLIDAIESSGTKPHIIFSSSTQEKLDNLYGKSKKEGRKLIEIWAKKTGSKFTGLIIPNVFGPFGIPFYNSVISTFSFQLTHEQKPEIIVDSDLKLIYIQELVEIIYDVIIQGIAKNPYPVEHTSVNKVSFILKLLESYKEQYYNNHIIPELKNSFEKNLFNTFRSYFDHKVYYPVLLEKHADERGIFTETVKTNIGGQFSFSSTKPGITRGNHFHIRKIERFIVIKGEALLKLRRIGTKEVLDYRLSGDKPSFVDMPVWYTHNITNIGKDELYTLFWINEFFDPADPDTFYKEV
jgi:UDP-2-acetamido-2,6-beta-L-arabino-hexul-4-ose reductase